MSFGVAGQLQQSLRCGAAVVEESVITMGGASCSADIGDK